MRYAHKQRNAYAGLTLSTRRARHARHARQRKAVKPFGSILWCGYGLSCLPLRQREIIVDMATGFDRRHPRGVIVIRLLVTAWLLALTGILLAYGYWGWALVTIAGAAANLAWAYRVYRAIRRQT
jgi:hypothetical protein